jgi:beta-lactamase superfamily II metal-dependent hydrolase
MIEARVFYVGRGSSVVIRLGEPGCGKYGIVDCFCGDARRHPLLEFLKRELVTSIEFLVLTHPHDDHFLGAGEIIRRYGDGLKKFFDWGIDPHQVMVSFYNSNAYRDSLAQKDLLAIRKFCRSRRAEGRVSCLTSPGIRIYEDRHREIVVETVAPSGDTFKKVQDSLSRYFQKCRQLIQHSGGITLSSLPKPNSAMDLNRLSSAVKIDVAGRSLVLGGDVLGGAWKKLLINGTNLDAHAVLLSHHGSHTGFPTKSWAAGFGRRNGIALVSGEGLHQPSPSVVKEVKAAGCQIYSTSVSGRSRRSHLADYVSKFHHGRGYLMDSKRDIIIRVEREGTWVEFAPSEIA